MAGKNSTALETINISGAAISAADAKLLAKLIRSSGAANIKILKLARNAISQQALKYIFEAWKYNQTITVLSLARSGINDKTVKYVAKMLSKNETLQELDLSSNRITASGMELLSEGLVLRTNRTLREINLAYNLFSGDAVSELMKGVAVNSTLESINFTNCGISTEGALAIAEVLPSARGLQNLGLTSNPDIAVEGYWALSNNLAKNHSMKGIQL
ncbi:hypothetical protein BKA57DRAFT_398104, partial [Linnemannia elongata]